MAKSTTTPSLLLADMAASGPVMHKTRYLLAPSNRLKNMELDLADNICYAFRKRLENNLSQKASENIENKGFIRAAFPR